MRPPRSSLRLRTAKPRETPEPEPLNLQPSPPSSPAAESAAPRDFNSLTGKISQLLVDREVKRRSADRKVQSHANETTEQTQLRQDETEKKPQQAKWDSFARYRSEKSDSFPDYVAPDTKMASRNRLKSINSATAPRNTFTSSSPIRREAQRNNIHNLDEPQVKRQRQEDRLPLTGTSSKHFAKPKPPHKEEVEDLTLEGSQDATYDSVSVSSAARGSSFKMSVLEFRQARPKPAGNSRKRKSRAPSGGGRVLSERHPLGSYTSPSRSPTTEQASDNSADDLATEDPAPSNVVSDILPRNKRGRPSQHPSSAHQVKRFKVRTSQESVEDSADELAQNSGKEQSKSRRTNFSQINPRQTQQIKPVVFSRGDIPSTKFTSMTTKGVGTDSGAMRLRRAVSGSNIYERGSLPKDQIDLHVGENCLEPKTADGRPAIQPWLRCDLSITQQVFLQCATNSVFVVNKRPKSQRCPNHLFLEFETPDGVIHLVERVPRDLVQEEKVDRLESMFQNAIQEAQKRLKSDETVSRLADSQSAGVEQHAQQACIANGAASLTNKPPPKREKLTAKLMRSAGHPPPQLDLTDEPEIVTPQPRSAATRRTRRSSPRPPARTPSPVRWTNDNPEWSDGWLRSLVFPAIGRNRARVDKDDIPRLDEGEFLNDNLISFYLRYLQVTLERERPDLLNKVYFFSTFFFEKLRSAKIGENYDGVKAWTAKVDLFSYDYIVVPVNENAHWYVAIICNAPNALNGLPDDDEVREVELVDVEAATSSPKMPNTSTDSVWETKSPRASGSPPKISANAMIETSSQAKSKKRGGVASKIDPREPKIVVLDSLGSKHIATSNYLKQYLHDEARDKKKLELKRKPMGLFARGIPEQDNYCDCGVYVLGYIEEFLKDPDEAARKLLLKESTQWEVKPPELRTRIRELLFNLQKEQTLQLDKEKGAKRKVALEKKSKKMTQQNSPTGGLAQASSQSPNAPVSMEGVQSSATVEAEPQVDGNGTTPSTPPARDSSPAKSSRIGTQDVVDEHGLISGLDDSSSEPPFYSAPTSPTRKSMRDVMRVERGLDPADGDLSTTMESPHFVRTLSSSSPDQHAADDKTRPSVELVRAVKRDHKAVKRSEKRQAATANKTRPSIEFVQAVKLDQNAVKKSEKRHVAALASSTPLESVEIESMEKDEIEQPRSGPQYDGVDPSVIVV